MKSSRILLILAGVFGLAVALFQAVIFFVPGWNAAFVAPSELVSNLPWLLADGLLMALIFGIGEE